MTIAEMENDRGGKSMTMRVDADGRMLRPNEGDNFVKRRAAEMVLPDVRQWLHQAGDPSPDHEIIDDLMGALTWTGGYEICKLLEQRGCWDVDAALVEILDGSFLSDACEEMTKKWVSCLGITLTMPLGATVRCGKQAPRGEGEIVKLFAETACYGVHFSGQQSTAYFVVFAENVSLVEADGTAAPGQTSAVTA